MEIKHQPSISSLQNQSSCTARKWETERVLNDLFNFSTWSQLEFYINKVCYYLQTECILKWKHSSLLQLQNGSWASPEQKFLVSMVFLEVFNSLHSRPNANSLIQLKAELKFLAGDSCCR